MTSPSTVPVPQTANQAAVYRRRFTTVPLAKAYLQATLLGPALAPVPVSYGAPDEADIGYQNVVLGDGDLDDDWASLGDGAEDENYTLNLNMSYRAAGGTQRDATEGAFALYNACATAIRGDRSLGGLVFSALLRFRQLREGVGPDGSDRLTLIRAGVRIKARI